MTKTISILMSSVVLLEFNDSNSSSNINADASNATIDITVEDNKNNS